MGVEDQREQLERHVAAGGKVAPYPDGPRLERFDPLELAQGLESEINRASARGLPMLRLDMNMIDAHALAEFMRRAVAAGVR
jgi:hypothetical protein